jgi:hypothetical protein
MFLGGFLLFLAIFTLAFWVLIFLSAVALPYAITQYVMEKFKKKQPDTATVRNN